MLTGVDRATLRTLVAEMQNSVKDVCRDAALDCVELPLEDLWIMPLLREATMR